MLLPDLYNQFQPPTCAPRLPCRKDFTEVAITQTHEGWYLMPFSLEVVQKQQWTARQRILSSPTGPVAVN